MTRAEKWLSYFASQTDKEEAEKMGAVAIRYAFDAVNNFMLSEEQRLAYINREMAIMDYNTNMRGFREEGWEEGKKEGKKEGATLNLLDNIRSLMKNMSLSATDAMKALSVPEDRQKQLAPLI